MAPQEKSDAEAFIPAPDHKTDDCCSADQHSPHKSTSKDDKALLRKYAPTGICFVLLMAGIVFDWLRVPLFEGYVRMAWYAAAYLFLGGNVLHKAFLSIKKGDFFNEFFLMSIATLGAFFIGEYAEGVSVMLFYVIGEHFQEAAIARSRNSIRGLVDNRPEFVTLVANGQYKEVSPKTIKPGDIIQVKAGEKASLDGILLSARSSFNTAALTGESKPDTKVKGETILAGMINMDHVVELQVTALYEDSALSKILKMVEQATSRKAKTQQFITKFAKVYTPLVVFSAIGIALLPYFFVSNYVFNDWLYKALVFLVVSCPCALVISIPLGYFGGIGAASARGILFKGSNYLDEITKVDTIVMDKTGTLTKGVFKVQQVDAVLLEERKLVAWCAALELHSTHPIAKAICEYANGTFENIAVHSVEEISGHGLKGTIEGAAVIAGNTKLLKKYNIAYDPKIDAIPYTTVVVAINNAYAGHITIADEAKEDAKSTIDRLREMGKEIIMLSGDKPQVVEAVAKQMGITKYFGSLLPEDKLAKVEELKRQGRKVAFVGDGINDAPVITLADVGIAMGGLGSDAAIETADVVIQTDQPSRLVTAIGIGKATQQVVWQNIGLAFSVKALVLSLGVAGMANMWEAVFADVGVALLAILNAVRIQQHHKKA